MLNNLDYLRSAEDPENEDITAANFSAVVCINLIELQSLIGE